MRSTGGSGGLCPAAAGDAVALVELMQQLKEQSGLTYRQLEQRAAERGEVLARSTLADVLRRRTLPRAELLAVFLRACGCAEDEVGAWLAARQGIEERAAAGAGEPSDGGEPPDAGEAPGGAAGAAVLDAPRRSPYRSRRVLLSGAAALVALLLAVGIPLLTGDGTAPHGAAAKAPLPTGEVRIRPLRAPGLCLTDGRVLRVRRYRTVAVQRPCAEAVPPQTHLTAAGAGRHRIQWTHRDHGKGCLVLLRESGLEGLLEPWDDCRAGGPAQLFRVEPAGGRTGAGGTAYRLRLSGEGAERCVTLGGDEPGATALARPCTGKDDQKFLIGPG
ncbi:XRE family transcriptional regulator [Streptomyces sp. Je 1-4]|uniref:RICIN domain-containing protein n=1 Tax=Streptomyces TaxID=1883 RepID=UPI0021D98894|nr:MULTISPECIES: XRE family transcriptional regulator [unclassified Streptomyces]UYB41958.1 XRE family transcriptional regulator [Streptomyces sp. Je 1-4]UZQ38229.1 XRE family transcriptional regulator [Streptomyces sp. Je 1-4] [Streptomyces sp. Je 1-4 4N24]UZQ45646.1 XRE family transcriptional regulator [Streptomyces sp. Je 1-4] [Streptomyces sp. Je 1-4 4N24_ara]